MGSGSSRPTLFVQPRSPAKVLAEESQITLVALSDGFLTSSNTAFSNKI